jgi:methionyl-tRNA formyltransferase
MTKIVLFANGAPGLDVCKFLVERNDVLIALYLCESAGETGKETIAASKLPACRIFPAEAVNHSRHLDWLETQELDFIITVYWPYLLKPNVFRLANGNTVNFHPALLPVNRGWFPHVHSILDGSPCGVTLHVIDEGIDSGPIWAQLPVQIDPTDTAKTIYDRLQQSIVDLFKEKWKEISSGRISPTRQDNSRAVYHKRSEISNFDEIDLDKNFSGRELINLLRARSFGNKGFAYCHTNGRKVYLNLRLSYDIDFY